MNERIAKLANESGFDVDKTGTFGDYSVMHRVEKFAELIIRECAEVANAHDCNHSGNDGAILNYFGVSV
jgi:hypothetical protein